MLLRAQPGQPRLHAVEQLAGRNSCEVVASERRLERETPGALAHVLGQHDLSAAEDLDLLEIFDRTLVGDVEGRQPLDLVTEQVDAGPLVRRGPEDVDDPAPDRQLAP